MVKEKKETYEFLSKLVVSLMNTDVLFTYDFFKREFPISDKTLSEMKRGEDKYIYQYVRIIRYMLETINLKILMDEILKQIRMALVSHYDLALAAVPHGSHGAGQPERWEVIMQWDGVIL